MNRNRTSTLILIAILAALSVAFAACGDDDDDASPAATSEATSPATGGGGGGDVTIEIGDNTFPARTEVSVGATVTWDWSKSSNPHSVIGQGDNAKDLIHSDVKTGEGTYSVTFTQAGTYEYICGVHGPSMAGTIVVS
jgi:plastocyanin